MTKILPNGITFLSSWNTDPVQGGWAGVQEVSPLCLQVDPSLTTPNGGAATQVNVNSSDVIYGGQRAEVAQMVGSNGQALSVTEGSGTQYIATSYDFPSTWAGQSLAGDPNSWSIILQLHGPNSLQSSPAFALMAAATTPGGPENYFITLLGGAVTSSSIPIKYQFSTDSQVAANLWTNFVIGINYQSTPTGSVQIWRQDQGQSGFTQVLNLSNVATLQYSAGQSVGDLYWKQGLYRGPDATGTSTFDFGTTAAGTSFNAVASAAFGTASGTTPTPTPTPTPAPTPDTLKLNVSEDAYLGDAQFIVKVNGTQVGGVLTSHAYHSTGDSDLFSLSGNWGAGVQNVQIQFLNDAYAGSPSTDRNLYVGSISYDGTTYAKTSAALYSNSTSSFVVGSGVSKASPPADTVTLKLAEDAYQGDAQFVLTLDGKTITTSENVTTLFSSGQWEDFSFSGNFGSGSHEIGVTFTNDAYGGSSAQDRNLYTDGISVNGNSYGSITKLLTTGATSSFAFSTAH